MHDTVCYISGTDWTKIADCFVGHQTFNGPGPLALINEVVQIANGFKEMSDATKNSCTEFEAAKEVIDTTDTAFLTDVARVYNKVQKLEHIQKWILHPLILHLPFLPE